MSDTVFTDGVTITAADWFNDVNRLHYTIFGDPANIAAVVGTFAASQAQQETGTSVAVAVTPGRQHFHASAAKAWVQYDSTGGTPSSYNLTSVTDNASGNLSPVWATDFSSDDYAVVATHQNASTPTAATTWSTQVISRSAGGCNITTIRLSDFTQIDVTYVTAVAYGDQA